MMPDNSWEETEISKRGHIPDKISKWGHVPDREIDHKSATYKYNASEKYHELLSEYKIMHKVSDGMFNGKSLLKFVDIIGNYLEKNDCISLLDYGAGKGILYSDRFKDLSELIDKPLGELWNLDSYKLYDPAFEEHDILPDPWEKGNFDAVICTDVLEHIPETDLKWVVDEILSYAGKIAFFNIACVPALKKFADGTNVHISVFRPKAWLNFFADMSFKYPKLKLYLFFDTVEKETDKLIIDGYKLEMYPQIKKLKQK